MGGKIFSAEKWVRTGRGTDRSPYGQVAVRTGRRTDRSPYGQVATCPYKTTQKHTMKTRKPNRHPFWNYSSDGAYFVTICTKNREHFFGEISGGKMVLNDVGEIVAQQWQWLESQYHHVLLDEWVVMPNHFHGIICIVNNDPVVAGRDVRDRSRPVPTETVQTTQTHSTINWCVQNHIIQTNSSGNQIFGFRMATVVTTTTLSVMKNHWEISVIMSNKTPLCGIVTEIIIWGCGCDFSAGILQFRVRNRPWYGQAATCPYGLFFKYSYNGSAIKFSYCSRASLGNDAGIMASWACVKIKNLSLSLMCVSFVSPSASKLVNTS